MTQAGWYPDPAGQPQTYRYWDGSTWSDATTGDPYAPPPGPPGPPVAPPPPPDAPAPDATAPDATVLAPGAAASRYGAVPPPPVAPPGSGYVQQPYGGGYPPAGLSRGSGRVVALVVAAAVVLVLLGVGAFLGIRALTGEDDTSTATDDHSVVPTSDVTVPSSSDLTVPTPPSPPESTAPTDQQCKGGLPDPSRNLSDTKAVGGGLVIPVPDGYSVAPSAAVAFTWADDFTPLQKVIEQNDQAQTGWVSIYGVGGLRKANGFTDPAQAAETVMACMAASTDLYQGFTGRTDLGSGAITVDHADAYQVTSELRVDNPDLSVEGDVAEVIVVDTGDPETFGLFISVVPIGDQQLIAQQTAFTPQIRVR